MSAYPMGGPAGPPPSAIQIGGPNHGAPAPPPGMDADGDAPVKNFKAALADLAADATEAAGLATDPKDKADIATIAAKIHTIIAGHQADEDSVMGGGPGVKVMRRAQAGA